MGVEFEKLEWDSEFFGFPVGKMASDINSKIQLKKLYGESDLDLIYYTTEVELDQQLLKNSYFDIILVDAKIAIRKSINRDAKIHPKVEIYKEKGVDPELLQLALTAGVHSRFFRDKNIPQSKSNELYKIWIERSVERKLADLVIVYREGMKIVGFITIITTGKEAHVSLLAVDPEFEGRGVSFALMNSTEYILSTMGFEIVKSETQDHNRKAKLVYQRQGLNFGEKHYIYHLWRNYKSE